MTRLRTLDPPVRHRRRRTAVRLAALTGLRARVRRRALLCLCAGAAVAGTALAQQPFDVALRDGLLSIRANDAPAVALAEALAGETGVSFVVTGDPQQAITVEIVDEPFDRAVAQLSPNHLLMRDGERADAPVIEVVLMLDDAPDGSGGAGGGAEFLPSGAPAEEIVPDSELAQPQGELIDQAAQQLAPEKIEFRGKGGLGAGAGADPLSVESGLTVSEPGLEPGLDPDGQPLGQ